MTRTQPGLFITVEGIDGCGKTTQLERLAAWLRSEGHTVVTTREPGGTPLGAQVRELLLHGDHVSPRAEALLFAADRAHHIDTLIAPALAEGLIVLCDRFSDSTRAYQGSRADLNGEDIETMIAVATDSLEPDVTLLFDLDPKDAMRRRVGSKDDRIEAAGLNFTRQVRERFMALAVENPQRIVVLDAQPAPDTVEDQVRAVVAERLAALI